MSKTNPFLSMPFPAAGGAWRAEGGELVRDDAPAAAAAPEAEAPASEPEPETPTATARRRSKHQE